MEKVLQPRHADSDPAAEMHSGREVTGPDQSVQGLGIESASARCFRDVDEIRRKRVAVGVTTCFPVGDCYGCAWGHGALLRRFSKGHLTGGPFYRPEVRVLLLGGTSADWWQILPVLGRPLA
jgi:hypothetical protein